MSEADPVKVERLLSLAETNPNMFWVLANVYNAQAAQNSSEDDMVSTCGTISDGTVIRN
jgi:hypothetical protein